MELILTPSPHSDGERVGVRGFTNLPDPSSALRAPSPQRTGAKDFLVNRLSPSNSDHPLRFANGAIGLDAEVVVATFCGCV